MNWDPLGLVKSMLYGRGEHPVKVKPHIWYDHEYRWCCGHPTMFTWANTPTLAYLIWKNYPDGGKLWVMRLPERRPLTATHVRPS